MTNKEFAEQDQGFKDACKEVKGWLTGREEKPMTENQKYRLLMEEGKKMHTKHEGKEEGVITMAYVAGVFILGRLVGGNKLADPRIFGIIENGQRIQMSPLPGTPPFVLLGSEGLRYTVPVTLENKSLFDLYDRVTHPQPNIVMPTGGLKLVTPDITGKLN